MAEPWRYLVWVTLDNPTPKGRLALRQALVNAFARQTVGIRLAQVEESSAQEVRNGLGDTQLGIYAPLEEGASEEIHSLLRQVIEDTYLVGGNIVVSAAPD